MICYDPRDGQHKQTDNPALIFAELAAGEHDGTFWSRVAELADYCEEPVDG